MKRRNISLMLVLVAAVLTLSACEDFTLQEGTYIDNSTEDISHQAAFRIDADGIVFSPSAVVSYTPVFTYIQEGKELFLVNEDEEWTLVLEFIDDDTFVLREAEAYELLTEKVGVEFDLVEE